MKHSNYRKDIRNTGEIVEMIGYYDNPENVAMNAPEMLSESELQTVFEIMKSKNVSILNIILAQQNKEE